MPAFAVPSVRGPVPATQPRSSSIPRAASQRSRSLTGPFPSGPSLTSPILTGTVVSGRRPRFAPVGNVRVSRPPLRLTRRGRIVVTVLFVAVLSVAVLLVTTLVSARAQATNHGQPRAGYQGMHQVVVRPGQTLWSIAAAAEPTADPRNVVQEIMAANALGTPGIAAGQLLWVP
jgi:LysM domain